MRARNERTYSTFRDKTLRAEALVLEMREDLTSLKDRLGNEVGELGTNFVFPFVFPVSVISCLCISFRPPRN